MFGHLVAFGIIGLLAAGRDPCPSRPENAGQSGESGQRKADLQLVFKVKGLT